MVCSLGFSQALPFNFSSPNQLMPGQEGTASSIVSDAGNDVLQIVGGVAFYDHVSIILGQNLNLADDANNTITFRIKSNVVGTRTHLLKFEQGAGGPATTELQFTTTGTDWQNIFLNFPAGLGNYAKIVLFTDFANALTGTYTIDDLAGGTNVTAPVVVAPTVAAPTPPVRNATDVINLYSSAYTEIAGTNWNPNWGQATVATEIQIAGNATRKMASLNYQGAVIATAQNVSTMTNLHLDVWTPDCNSFSVFLISPPQESPIVLTPTLSGWNSFDIPLSSYTVVNLNAIKEMKFVSGTAGTSVYMDNIYFWKPSGTTPTLTQMSLPVTFESTTVDYGLISFGGTASTIVVDPTLSTNKVAKVIKSGPETWAGTTVTGAAELGFSPAIPFTATERKMNVRVWSPTAGTTVRLKVEVHGIPSQSVETNAVTTVANGWQTLEFDFNAQAAGTGAFNAAFPYDKASIFFDFNVVGSGQTYYFDDVKFGAAVVVLTQMSLPVTFESTTVDYGLISFGGTASTVVVDPTLSTNKVAKVIKSGPETWAGTTVTGAAELGFSPAIPFTATERKMNVRVWSPTAGTTVRLKVEVHGIPSQSVETNAVTTVANGWQTLEFDFNAQAAGTGAFNAAFPYDKASIFFDFGVVGSGQTYYFDDINFGATLSLPNFTASNIKMYPNPTSSVFSIEANEIVESVSLFNVLGQEVLTKYPNSNSVTLDIANFQTGIYVVKTTIGGVSYTSRIVKK